LLWWIFQTFSPISPEIALGTSQVDCQRYHLKVKSYMNTIDCCRTGSERSEF
jgi:hypothetical protein